MTRVTPSPPLRAIVFLAVLALAGCSAPDNAFTRLGMPDRAEGQLPQGSSELF